MLAQYIEQSTGIRPVVGKATKGGLTITLDIVPIIASKEYIAASQHIFAVSHTEALCIKTNDCTFAA